MTCKPSRFPPKGECPVLFFPLVKLFLFLLYKTTIIYPDFGMPYRGKYKILQHVTPANCHVVHSLFYNFTSNYPLEIFYCCYIITKIIFDPS